MPWYDPESDPAWLDYLHTRPPKRRTSTYKKDSPNSILGEAGEIVVTDRIRKILESKGLNWSVGRTGDVSTRMRMLDLGPSPDDDDPWVAITNSKLGDVHVVDHRGRRRLSFEVKASMTYDNATIDERELSESEADYLVGVTKVGLWVCSMDEARRTAQLKHGPFGKFYVIPYYDVRKVTLDEIFPSV